MRVVDLITNLDMAAFQSHSGLSIFIYRLEVARPSPHTPNFGVLRIFSGC